MKTDSVRVIDRNGKFVAWLTPERAQALAGRGAGVYSQQGKRRGLLTLKANIQEFEDVNRSDRRTTYTERFEGREVVTLKRVGPDGSLHRWDKDLTFDDLRAGRARHKATQAERIEQLERAA